MTPEFLTLELDGRLAGMELEPELLPAEFEWEQAGPQLALAQAVQGQLEELSPAASVVP